MKKTECSMCERGMGSDFKHFCYGELRIERHIIAGKDVCHECWDAWLLDGVEEAEKQLKEAGKM